MSSSKTSTGMTPNYHLEDKTDIEDILVQYHDIFAKHRLDIGINHDFKIKLTPKHDQPVYTQSRPCPIHLKDDLTVELALMQYYGIITTLPFSKYASPIFAQRKPSGKLRLLVDLRKINNLISDDYHNNNHPVSTLSDAAQHLAGKQLFCKLDCSQAYHVLQMADQQSVELLAFNFASRTFAYRRLAQGLSRSLSSFSSFMREKLDRVIKADKCAQYVDDIGIAANTATELKRNIADVFQCLREAGLRLTMSKCQFGAKQVEYLGKTVSAKGIAPQTHKIQKYLEQLKFPRSKKALQRYLGFVNYYRTYIPRLSEKLAPFHQLLKTEQPIKVAQETQDKFHRYKQCPNKCLRIMAQTTITRQTICHYDRRQLQCHRLRTDDRRRPHNKSHICQKDIRASRFRLKNLHTNTNQVIHIRQRILGNLPRIHRIQSHTVGSSQTSPSANRQ